MRVERGNASASRSFPSREATPPARRADSWKVSASPPAAAQAAQTAARSRVLLAHLQAHWRPRLRASKLRSRIDTRSSRGRPALTDRSALMLPCRRSAAKTPARPASADRTRHGRPRSPARQRPRPAPAPRRRARCRGQAQLARRDVRQRRTERMRIAAVSVSAQASPEIVHRRSLANRTAAPARPAGTAKPDWSTQPLAFERPCDGEHGRARAHRSRRGNTRSRLRD